MTDGWSPIEAYILDNLEDHSTDIATVAVEKFHISRQAVHKHLRKLEESGWISSEGNTRNKIYSLRTTTNKVFPISIAPGLAEDRAWRETIDPLLRNVQPNVRDICHYGFTEIFNNVLDHAEATSSLITIEMTALKIKMHIMDDGIGIFEKIQQTCQLEDHRHAILELAKGKLTTDPKRHTGEGIFFTTRMFDKFSILSGQLYFSHSGQDDWLIEDAENIQKGTSVFMTIQQQSPRTAREVFDIYAGESDFGFSKTHVPVSLAVYGNDSLISRSQAKRLLVRFDRFKEVFLDFDGVESIGHAFADEIFRVYKLAHPKTQIIWINANTAVARVIEAKLKESEGT